MKHYFLIPSAIMAFGAITFLGTGCNNDDCKPGEDCGTDEPELITKLEIEFSDSATGALAFTAGFNDPDGIGGTAATIDSLIFNANATYNANISVAATANNQEEDITPEILAEKSDHLFCFEPAGANITVQRTDSDGTYPLGLTSRFRIGPAGQGSIRITLKHQPDGAKDGTCTPGDTDIEVDFPVRIQ